MAGVQPLSFGQLLNRFRRGADLTQEELAERAGLSVDCISALERGVNRGPRRDTLQLLAAALNLAQHEQEAFLTAARRAAKRSPMPEFAQSRAAPEGYEPLLPVGGLLGTRPEGPLVARAAEMSKLEAALAAVLGGAGRLVVLAGEPGVGKTRLAQEVTLRAHACGMLVATGCSYESLGGTALAPVADALEQLYAAAPPTVRSEVHQRWPEVLRLLPETAEPEPTSAIASITGIDGQQRLFWQVSGFVRALAAGRPVALLLDDLHWADEASLALLQHLARQTRGAPVLLVGTYRDVELHNRRALRAALHELGRERLLERVPVRTLAAAGTADLLAALLGVPGEPGGQVTSALVEQFQQATGGLPLFIQQELRVLQERGELELRDGQWQRRTPGELDVSDDVRDAIGSRVERLCPKTQTVLEEASVLGQVFTSALLQRVCMCKEAEVEAALEEALLAGLLQETTRQGEYEAEYGFKHALMQRAIYTAIPAPRRRRLHRTAAMALEAASEGKRPWHAATLAWHFLQGDAVVQALSYTLKAGDQAEVVYAHAEAEHHYQLAVKLACELNDEAREAEVREKLGDVLRIVARDADAENHYRRAAAIYQSGGDLDRLVIVTTKLARVQSVLGRPDEEAATLKALVSVLAEDTGDGDQTAVAARVLPATARLSPIAATHLEVALAGMLEQQGRIAEALAATGRAAHHARTAQDQHMEAHAIMRSAAHLSMLGRLAESAAVSEEAIRLLEQCGELAHLPSSLTNLGAVHEERGNLEQSRILHRRALAIAQQIENLSDQIFVLGNLAEVAFFAGEWSQAQNYVEQALALCPTGSMSTGGNWMHCLLAVAREPLSAASPESEARLARLAGSEDVQVRAYVQAALAERDLVRQRPHRALERLEPLVAQHGTNVHYLNWHRPLLAWAAIELGERERAEDLLHQTLDQPALHERRLFYTDALRIQGLVALRGRRWSEAAAALDQALALAREIAYPYAEAKALYVHGQLSAAKGEPGVARERFAQALAILHCLGERLYAEPIEHALILLQKL